MELFDYQKIAIDDIVNSSHGKLIYLPPGSGKSLILYNIMERNGGPVLLISKRYVIAQHIFEIPKYTSFIIKDIDSEIDEHTCICAKAHLLSKNIAKLIRIPFKLIIFDESHLFKNPNTDRTISALILSYRFRNIKRICATATPCPEGLWEIQPQIELMDIGNPLGDGKDFNRRYVRRRDRGSHWETYLVREQEIKTLIAPYIFTHKGIKMPKQVYKNIPLEMSEKLKSLYVKANNECVISYNKEDIFICKAKWIKLLALCSGLVKTEDGKWNRISSEKVDTIAEIVEDIPTQVLIWCLFKEESRWLSEKIPDSKMLSGGISDGEAIVDGFKAGKFKTLITNPDCIGEGVSLENCQYQIFSSIGGSGKLYYQAVTRTNRKSQKGQEFIYKVFFKGTVLEHIFEKVLDKNKTEKEIMRSILERNMYDT